MSALPGGKSRRRGAEKCSLQARERCLANMTGEGRSRGQRDRWRCRGAPKKKRAQHPRENLLGMCEERGDSSHVAKKGYGRRRKE